MFGGMFDVVGAALTSGLHDSRQLSAVAGTWSIATRILRRSPPPNTPMFGGNIASPAPTSYMKAAQPRPVTLPGS